MRLVMDSKMRHSVNTKEKIHAKLLQAQLADLLSFQVKGYIWESLCVTEQALLSFYHPSATGKTSSYKACWSWPEPANEVALQPSLSTTICLMNCQSLSRGWPSPKSRGNQSLQVWTLNYPLLLKLWAQVKAFRGTFMWKCVCVLVRSVKIVALDACETVYYWGLVYIYYLFKDSGAVMLPLCLCFVDSAQRFSWR